LQTDYPDGYATGKPDGDHLCSQCTYFTEKIRIVRCEKSRFYPVLTQIRITKSGKAEDFHKEKRRNFLVPPVLSGFGEDAD